MDHELLTAKEVKAILKVSLSRAYELMADRDTVVQQFGEPLDEPNPFPRAIRIGSSVRISRAALEAWIDKELELAMAPEEVAEYPERHGHTEYKAA